MRPYRSGVWRKGNRRASRGEPRPRREVYWPVCGSPAVAYEDRRETPTGGVEWLYRCASCGHVWAEPHWVPLAEMKKRRHHVPKGVEL